MYRYSSDPNEFTNLANDQDFADIKAKLREQLIALRDGNRWKGYKSLPLNDLAAFEMLAEVRGRAAFRLGDTLVAEVESADWAPVRIRVAGKRSQVWLNNRVASDQVQDSEFAAGMLTTSTKLRNIRIRKL